MLEGAGSPAEINLKDRDIVNLRMAAAADAPACLSPTSIAAARSPRWPARWRCSSRTNARASGPSRSPSFAATRRCSSRVCARWKRALGIPCSGGRAVARRDRHRRRGRLPAAAALRALARARGPAAAACASRSSSFRTWRTRPISTPWPRSRASRCAASRRRPNSRCRRRHVARAAKRPCADLRWLRARGFGCGAARARAHARRCSASAAGCRCSANGIDDPDGVEGGGSTRRARAVAADDDARARRRRRCA